MRAVSPKGSIKHPLKANSQNDITPQSKSSLRHLAINRFIQDMNWQEFKVPDQKSPGIQVRTRVWVWMSELAIHFDFVTSPVPSFPCTLRFLALPNLNF